MNIDMNKLINTTPGIIDSEICTCYSILVPIIRSAGHDSLVFEVRSDKLTKQPSEICFPGGRIENGESKEAAALRETSEELMISQGSIRLINELDTVVTPFNKILYPFAGTLENYEGTYNEDEVKEIFTVPVDYLLTAEPQYDMVDVILEPSENFHFEYVQNGRDYPWVKGKYPVYFYFYENKIIWGMTAKILRNFIRLIKS